VAPQLIENGKPLCSLKLKAFHREFMLRQFADADGFEDIHILTKISWLASLQSPDELP